MYNNKDMGIIQIVVGAVFIGGFALALWPALLLLLAVFIIALCVLRVATRPAREQKVASEQKAAVERAAREELPRPERTSRRARAKTLHPPRDWADYEDYQLSAAYDTGALKLDNPPAYPVPPAAFPPLATHLG